MNKESPIYAFIDPSSEGYSASRMLSAFFAIMDAIWVGVTVLGLPPKDSYLPISSMLATCTMSAFGAYGINSFGRAMGSSILRWAGRKAQPLPQKD